MKRDNKKINTNTKNTHTFKKSESRKVVRKNRHISIFRLSVLILVITLILLGLYFVAKSSVLALSSISNNAIEKVKYIRENNDIENLKKTETINIDTEQVTQKEMQREIINNLSKIANIPDEEIDAFNKVSDPDTLANQSPLFKGIKKGDYIVLYPSLIVLYDAENNKVIRSMPR